MRFTLCTITMIDKKIFLPWIDFISQKDVDFFDLYWEDSEIQRILCENNAIEPITEGKSRGVGVRLVKGEETFFVNNNDLVAIRESFLQEAINQAGLPTAAGIKKDLCFSELQPAYIFPVVKSPQTVPLEEKIKLINLINQTARNFHPAVKEVVVRYSHQIKQIKIYSSLNGWVEEKRTYLVLTINCVAEENGLVQTAYQSLGGYAGFEYLESQSIVELAKATAERAVNLLRAEKSPVGEMPVVISSQAGGTMIHEAIGHSLEADAVQKGISPVYQGKLGQKVASELITVLDDPTIVGRRGSYQFDDEATPGKKNILVENGVLKNYLYDLRTSRKDETVSSGNGRRESYQHKPIPRMSNTFIAPGKDNPEEIIRSVEKGIYVARMGGGEVNTATGDFVFDVEEGYRLLNGKIGPLLRGAILLGNGPEALRSIDRVGRDLGWSLGTCGKDNQGVPVSDAQPTLRIPKLVVGGEGQKNAGEGT